MAVVIMLFCLVAIGVVIARRRERVEGCFTPSSADNVTILGRRTPF
jgi:hypothetical protein